MALHALFAAALLVPSVQESAPRAPLELLEALSAEPRIVGTPGYERAMAIVAEELVAAGLELQYFTTKTVRAIPRRSDVLLFEDGIASDAFAGLRERWSPDTVPTSPMPAAYEWNPESADVRGPIVDCGSGDAEAFELLASRRVDPTGAVALISMPLTPSERTDSVRAAAERARDAGCIALLIAPSTAGPTVDDFVLADTAAPWPMTGEQVVLALPTAPIRSREAAAIRERLRAKRVRGEDGSGTTIRVGPGPVEARVVVECAREWVSDVPLIRATWLPTDGPLPPAYSLVVDMNDRLDRPLAGAVALTAALLAARSEPPGGIPAEAVRPKEYVGAIFKFGPASYPSAVGFQAAESERLRVRLTCALAPQQSLRDPGRLVPIVDETLDRLSTRLADELPTRLDAASRWIAYSLRSLAFSDPFSEPRSDPAPVDLPEALRAPLPTRR